MQASFPDRCCTAIFVARLVSTHTLLGSSRYDSGAQTISHDIFVVVPRMFTQSKQIAIRLEAIACRLEFIAMRNKENEERSNIVCH